MSKVLYIVEKDDKIDYSLSTHSDIENISIYPNEKEVLFFPFSSFEIKDINERIYNNEKIYEIKLLYLGKYLKEIENLDASIPDSTFKKELKELGLIPEKKMKKTKEVINQYKELKIFINNNKNKGNKNEIKNENEENIRNEYNNKDKENKKKDDKEKENMKKDEKQNLVDNE